MQDQDTAAPPVAPSPPDAVPAVRIVTAEPSPHEPPGRPWELELLISGAVVFALLQVPSVLDNWLERLVPHVSGAGISALMLTYTVASIVLYALIGAFVVHLSARAYWVGLVGLDTVFPNGVRWESVRVGPIAREFQRARQPSLQELTDRADRFCSIIFSFSFSLALLLAGSLIPVALMSAVVLGLSRLWDVATGISIATATALLMGVLVIPILVDRRFGERIDPAGRLGRLLRASMKLQYMNPGIVAARPIINVLSSNVPRRVFYASMVMVFVAVEGAFFLKLDLDGGAAGLFDYSRLPERPGARSIEYEHYADEWPEGKIFGGSATIQSEVVHDPFVRLFLPFSPRRHNPAMAQRCPTLPTREDEREAAVIHCMLEIQPVTLNGRPVGEAGFHYYTDPRTGLRGIVAFLPTRGLPAGENRLVVAPIPPTPGRSSKPETQYIPFWVAP